jgi:hypothetical protein
MRPISGSAGKSRAEVIGKKVDVWPARMAAIFGARDEQIIATGETVHAEGSHPMAGGKMRHYEYELTRCATSRARCRGGRLRARCHRASGGG